MKEREWDINAIYAGKENAQEMYHGTAITTINRQQKTYLFKC